VTPTFWRIVIAGVVFTAAMCVLAVTEARLGTPVFFACSAAAAAAYLVVLARIWRAPTPAHRGAFLLALAFALAFRAPLAVSPVNAGSDMFRYLWDGRVQRLGYNPYSVLPADPALASTHVDDNTRLMSSGRSRTPYPPGAELFFRLVSVAESVYVIRAALVACDLLTIFFVWRWLQTTGRSEWLTLAYAWNPLVVLEVAFSGHVDALCALWISVCAYMLARRRTAFAATAFVLAVASKLLPIVLAPMLWRRIRVRDAALGALVIVLLYLPFMTGSNPFAELDAVVERIRFNGPFFQAVAGVGTPNLAAAVAVVLGLLVAAACRWKLAEGDPAAWAWPMAASILAAPVIYPWYLLSLTPFLLVPATLPLIAWTLSVLAVYTVWEIALAGGQWAVPGPVLVLQYAFVFAASLVAVFLKRSFDLPPTHTVSSAVPRAPDM